MSIPVIQAGAIGVVFVFTVRDQAGTVVDLSTATTIDGLFRAGPKGVLKRYAGSLLTDGTDGKFFYETVADTDIDVAHDHWERQGDIVVPGLYTGRTEVKSFPVKPNLI